MVPTTATKIQRTITGKCQSLQHTGKTQSGFGYQNKRRNCGFRQIPWFPGLHMLHSMSACHWEAQFSTVCTALD